MLFDAVFFALIATKAIACIFEFLEPRAVAVGLVVAVDDFLETWL